MGRGLVRQEISSAARSAVMPLPWGSEVTYSQSFVWFGAAVCLGKATWSTVGCCILFPLPLKGLTISVFCTCGSVCCSRRAGAPVGPESFVLRPYLGVRDWGLLCWSADGLLQPLGCPFPQGLVEVPLLRRGSPPDLVFPAKVETLRVATILLLQGVLGSVRQGSFGSSVFC